MVFYPCDFEANAEDAKFVSAKLFIEFLHEEYGEERIMEMVSLQGDSVTRRWFRWRNELDSGLLRVDDMLDKFLTEVLHGELTIHDIPCEIFSFADDNNPKRYRSQAPLEERIRIAKRVAENGERIRDVADDSGRSHVSVSKWASLYRTGKLVA